MQGLSLLLFALLALTTVNADRGWKVDSDPRKNVTNTQVKFSEDTIRRWFTDYTAYYKKTYKNVTESYINFRENVLKVTDINSNYSLSSWASANELSDMDISSMKEKFLTPNLYKYVNNVSVSSPNTIVKASLSVSAPNYIDWTTTGYVSPVKSQKCGDCWSYAATTALEASYMIATNTKGILLDADHLTNCADLQTYFSSGCNGGSSDGAMNYVTDWGIPTLGTAMSCKVAGAPNSVQLNGYQNVYSVISESALMELVAQRPVVTYLAVGGDAAFWSYAGGIYRGADVDPSACASYLNHAVTIVGYYYTGDRSSSYWILQNNWGSGWGTGGKINFGFTNNPNGVCGIYLHVVAPPLSWRRTLSGATPTPTPRRSPPPPTARSPPPPFILSPSPPPPPPPIDPDTMTISVAFKGSNGDDNGNGATIFAISTGTTNYTSVRDLLYYHSFSIENGPYMRAISRTPDWNRELFTIDNAQTIPRGSAWRSVTFKTKEVSMNIPVNDANLWGFSTTTNFGILINTPNYDSIMNMMQNFPFTINSNEVLTRITVIDNSNQGLGWDSFMLSVAQPVKSYSTNVFTFYY